MNVLKFTQTTCGFERVRTLWVDAGLRGLASQQMMVYVMCSKEAFVMVHITCLQK